MDGALVGARCFVSQQAAADAYYGSVPPAQAAGATSYLQQFVKVAGAWRVQRYQATGSGDFSLVADTAAPSLTFPTCDPTEAFKDGMTVGWGVVAAMVLVWGVAVLRRGL